MSVSLKVPAVLASLCAFVALLVVATMGPMICREITDAWTEFDQDMSTFKVISDDLWYEMIEMAKTEGFNRNRRFATQRLKVTVRPTRPRPFADTLLARPPARQPRPSQRISHSREHLSRENRNGRGGVVPPLPSGPKLPPRRRPFNSNDGQRRRNIQNSAPARRPQDWHLEPATSQDWAPRRGPARRPTDFSTDPRIFGPPIQRAVNNVGYGYPEEEEELPIPSRPPPPSIRQPTTFTTAPEISVAGPNSPDNDRFGRNRGRPGGLPDDYFTEEGSLPSFQQVFIPDGPPGVSPHQGSIGPGPQCNCDTSLASRCPSGLAGVQGSPGEGGDRGIPGPHGLTGVDAHDVQMETYTRDECFTCTSGPAGPTGEPGNIGLPGGRGTSGNSGRNGNHGLPGRPGIGGGVGTEGSNGNAGRQGERGECAVFGTPGNKGRKGNSGTSGQAGDPGRTGLNGPDGFDGDQGVNGPVGKSGAGGPGGIGETGEAGRPGNDGVYCSCPKREFFNPGDEFVQTQARDSPLIPHGWKHNSLWKKKA